MKQIVIDKPLSVKIEEVPKPGVGPKEVLIKTKFSGVSVGTEKAFYHGKWGIPINPGYEAVGDVVERGTQVKDLSIGDRVICLGNHAEYIRMSEDAVVEKIPSNLTYKEATFAILGTTASHAIERCRLRKGDSIAIIGLGVLGQMILQYARLERNAKTIGVDIIPEKLQNAKKLGAELVINSGSKDGQDMIRKISKDGVDVAVEVAGGVQNAVDTAMQIVRKNGRVLIMGGGTATNGIIKYPYRDNFFSKELEVVSSNSWGRYGARNFRKIIGLLSEGKLTGKGIRITTVKYTQIKKLYDDLLKDTGKYFHVILEW